jgi:hypothetical protein
MTNQIERSQFIDALDVKDVPLGKMKQIQVGEREIYYLQILVAKCMRYAIDAVT